MTMVIRRGLGIAIACVAGFVPAACNGILGITKLQARSDAGADSIVFSDGPEESRRDTGIDLSNPPGESPPEAGSDLSDAPEGSRGAPSELSDGPEPRDTQSELSDGPEEPQDAGSDSSDGSDEVDGAPSGEIITWATWPMPNPPYLGYAVRAPTGLPNLQSYEYRPDSQVVIDDVTGLVWERYPVDETYDLHGAQDHCTGLVLDGHQDWRLPSRVELISILDYTITIAGTGEIDPSAFPNAPDGKYWTVSITPNPTTAWTVDFGTAFFFRDYETGQYRARCVRRPTPQPPLPSHYDFSQMGAVRDNWTMLTWERVTSPVLMSGYDAITYCRSLRPPNTWRVPTLKELETLVNETTVGALDLTVFPDPVGLPDDARINLFWTSSWAFNNQDYGYWIDFVLGLDDENVMVNNLRRVRCVR